MPDIPRYMIACLHTGKLACLAILVSSGIIMHILACALYDNWWPMLTDGFHRFISRNIYIFSRPLLGFKVGIVIVTCLLAAIMYILLPMPLLFFVGSDASSLLTETGNTWVNITKFLTGSSVVGSIAIPAILKHAGIIGWGALSMELSSFLIFVLAIVCYIRMNGDDDDYFSV